MPLMSQPVSPKWGHDTTSILLGLGGQPGGGWMQRDWVMSGDYRLIIAALIAERQARKMSQREIARRLGKHPSFVNKIELLERRLDVLEFVAIAHALEMRPDQLLARILSQLPDKPKL